jgi:hypothetical protein
MMKIKLMELEVENKLIEISESQETKDKELKLAVKQVQELKQKAEKAETRSEQFKVKAVAAEKERDDLQTENSSNFQKLQAAQAEIKRLKAKVND